MNNLSQAMKLSGQDDVRVGKVDCMANKQLCNEAYLKESKLVFAFHDQ